MKPRSDSLPASAVPVLVLGHRKGDAIWEFPHLCPGEGCAIRSWLYQIRPTVRIERAYSAKALRSCLSAALEQRA
jgi:hypothetical protein